MATLPTDLRNKLERVVIEARDAAEAGARAALEALAVHHHEPYPHMKPGQRELRNHLRARARQLGDRQDASGRLAIDHLAVECAYDHWHRMLFARFLAENNLLIEPENNMAINLAEAEELSKEEGVDVWVYASRCAQRMLPQIFRPDDPLLQVSFATEHMLKLEKLLAFLPVAVFTASDALGWVYQFWQSKKKDEINRSEVKIGADEISAVTQLFTEPYMVEFLLHNTLGAWWTGRKLSPKDFAGAKTEDELRAKIALPGVGWEYLRFVRGENGIDGPWRPAAGTFDSWPKSAKDIKGLDPCCGSGHFLVALFRHLVPIRMVEEGLSTGDAVDAVLRDNLYGLEIDERCCQIAAFALAFAAWTYPKADGYRFLPEMHIACTGIGPQTTEEDWVKLTEKSGMPTETVERERIKNGLLNLHRLFSQAPTLGALINPVELPSDLFAADYETIQPYLNAVVKAEKADDETYERAVAAAGMVKAADLLAGEYTLVITNVPYLKRGNQGEILKQCCGKHFPNAQKELATVFLLRCLSLNSPYGTTAIVLPQNWLFLKTYRELRQRILQSYTWRMLARLGAGAFETISGEVVKAILLCIDRVAPSLKEDGTFASSAITGLDVASVQGAPAKAMAISKDPLVIVQQTECLTAPDYRVTLETSEHRELLGKYAQTAAGLSTFDRPRFIPFFWEVPARSSEWQLLQSTVNNVCAYGGCEHALLWECGNGQLRELMDLKKVHEGYTSGIWRAGEQFWGSHGILVSLMGNLPATLYCGGAFDQNTALLVPRSGNGVETLWCFCESSQFNEAVRAVDQSLKVTTATIEKIHVDWRTWEAVAENRYPDGLPEPDSDDPTQWVFPGRPDEAQEGTELQVGVARLLGYRWPAELDDMMRLSKRARAMVKKCGELAKFADNDGIVCIPALRGEEPATKRLLHLLNACGIQPEVDLDNWLRNSFFEEHCKLFHNRPFVWHIWDGRKRDGFHALVNYHKLAEGGGKGRRLLESLTYAYLGDWIIGQKDEVKQGGGGAEDRLAAAIELQNRLKSIIEGEPPFDIFVRWKPLAKQPIGWEPDINDGVRVNIRPFLASDLPGGRTGAGVLRWKPNIKWTKDRGKEPERPKAEYPWFWNWDERTLDFMGTGKEPDGNRYNDCHYTNKVKQAARDGAKKGGK